MIEHALGYTINAALELARGLKHGPLLTSSDPLPTVEKAVAVIRQERKSCGFNWITGETAQAVVTAYLVGMQADDAAVSPYADWSDEHRAWREGRSVGR